jgi:hypothetical protein
VTLAAGSAQSFTWEYSALGAGSVRFTGTVTGVDASAGGTLTASSSCDLTISVPPGTTSSGSAADDITIKGGHDGAIDPTVGEVYLAWVPKTCFGFMKIKIYDTKGNLIYQRDAGQTDAGFSVGFTNNWRKLIVFWDGTDSGKRIVPPGTYYGTIKLAAATGKSALNRKFNLAVVKRTKRR